MRHLGKRRTERDQGLMVEVMAFGELLAAHPFQPGTPGTPPDAVTDWTRALDAYEAACRSLRRNDREGVLRHLDDGRYAMACLESRLAGGPPPARLPPCFFDPRHGPSTAEVPWMPPAGTRRDVPVCAADAVRLREGSLPIASGHPARLPTAPVPPPRDRIDQDKLALSGLAAAFIGYAAVLFAVGDRTGAVLYLAAGYVPPGVAVVSGFHLASWAPRLWRLIRRSHLTLADFDRSEATSSGRRDVYAVVDVSGRRYERARKTGAPSAEPLPQQRVWYLRGRGGEGELLGFWSVLWLPLGVAVALPVFAASLAATFYLFPGRLVLALLS
ncbi:hypothetical protein ACFW2Y_03310 [Streptomyces sp. NPDC058877]|uniref:hypothetical protein n=1 Tax=Streptomyces sp. NPDC058877 TaxID=3346665 RepID=UPI0036969E78